MSGAIGVAIHAPVSFKEALTKVFEHHHYAQPLIGAWKCECGKKYTSKEAHLAEVAHEFVNEHYRFKKRFDVGTYTPKTARP